MTDPKPLRTLLVDDEPLAIERMQILCARTEGIDLIGTAQDGESALRMVEALQPELLLLDIAMPGMDGMEVARALEHVDLAPAIIFVTAFDKFAVEAFDVAAVDYLLKPVAPERLEKALARVTEQLRETGDSEAEPSPWTEEFWVPHRSEVIRLAADDIDRIEAERDYMRLHIGERSYLLHQTISHLEERLDPARFMRVHRSSILNRDRIAKLRHDGSGGWYAEMEDGAEVRIGRTYLKKVKQIAGK
ncbi:response regulator transcription factor [Parasphingopyxis algicola]|uniref:LytR/AlgR family response regulator transcription factor n=1 Tax=Parasphingopyxis algicola TaxID=2026624 RepID=UPI00159F88A2|nr:LytTR family DNA-binding domain-containing protein [Parasphingopyxis algicola]QLC25906.1 response regulator transcription factor [Parasphingopyxis algicola]